MGKFYFINSYFTYLLQSIKSYYFHLQFSAVCPLDAKHKKDSFFAVYDGHGTTVVADTLKEHLHKYISKN